MVPDDRYSRGQRPSGSRPGTADEQRRADWHHWDDVYDSCLEQGLVMVVEMVGASALKHQLSLREALWRQHDHNRTIARLLGEAKKDDEDGWARVAKTLTNGLLVMADAKHADAALALAWRIMDTFQQQAEKDGGQLAIRSRIGVAFGNVVLIPPAEIAGGDVQGMPVDTAARLVSDSGTPGQILLDSGAHDAIRIREVESIVCEQREVQLGFDPPEGTSQRLRNGDEERVWQLRWREGDWPIVNRRVLIAEALDVQKGGLGVMKRVNDLNRLYRAAIYGRNAEIGKIIEFYEEMKALPRDEGEVGVLRSTWEATTEAASNHKLVEVYGAVIEGRTTACTALGGAEAALNRGTTEFTLAILCIRDAWSGFERASMRLLSTTQTIVGNLQNDE